MQNIVPLFFKKTCHFFGFLFREKIMTSFCDGGGCGFGGLQSRFVVAASVYAL